MKLFVEALHFCAVENMWYLLPGFYQTCMCLRVVITVSSLEIKIDHPPRRAGYLIYSRIQY